MTRAENYVTLEFLSRSNNESFARTAAAGFAAQLDPTLDGAGRHQDCRQRSGNKRHRPCLPRRAGKGHHENEAPEGGRPGNYRPRLGLRYPGCRGSPPPAVHHRRQ